MALSPATLQQTLHQWVSTVLSAAVLDEILGICLDGKTLCNSLTPHARSVQLLALLDQKMGGVLSQLAVPGNTNEAKAALTILKTIVLQGRVMTGDAMFCHRQICQEVVGGDGDYRVVVKDNQPELKAAVVLLPLELEKSATRRKTWPRSATPRSPSSASLAPRKSPPGYATSLATHESSSPSWAL